MTQDEMVGWHHRLDEHEFEQAPGVGDGQGSLACCSPWGRRVGHDGATEQQPLYVLQHSGIKCLLLITKIYQSLCRMDFKFLLIHIWEHVLLDLPTRKGDWHLHPELLPTQSQYQQEAPSPPSPSSPLREGLEREHVGGFTGECGV